MDIFCFTKECAGFVHCWCICAKNWLPSNPTIPWQQWIPWTLSFLTQTWDESKVAVFQLFSSFKFHMTKHNFKSSHFFFLLNYFWIYCWFFSKTSVWPGILFSLQQKNTLYSQRTYSCSALSSLPPGYQKRSLMPNQILDLQWNCLQLAHKALHKMVTHHCDDHTPLCITTALESECCCCVLPAPLDSGCP